MTTETTIEVKTEAPAVPAAPAAPRTIKNTQEVLDFFIAIYTGAHAALADGKFDGSDLGAFLPALMKLPNAVADIGLIGGELKNLDEAELGELLADLNQLGFTDPKLLVYVTEGVTIVKSLFKIIKTVTA